MASIEFFRQMLQQANLQGSRSTALNPLGWAMATVLAAFVWCVAKPAPTWAKILLGVFASILMLLYIGAYLFFMVKDRDALRSERFTLSKMAIERTVLGDDRNGLIFAEGGKPALPFLESDDDAPEDETEGGT